MTETMFDTLEMVRRLEAKGFTPEQAEGVTQAVRTGVTGGVATKADLADVRADMAELRADLTARIDRLDARVSADLKWMKAIGGVIVALLAVASRTSCSRRVEIMQSAPFQRSQIKGIYRATCVYLTNAAMQVQDFRVCLEV